MLSILVHLQRKVPTLKPQCNYTIEGSIFTSTCSPRQLVYLATNLWDYTVFCKTVVHWKEWIGSGSQQFNSVRPTKTKASSLHSDISSCLLPISPG